VVLHGCKTWNLTLGEYDRLRLLEKQVLRIILGPMRDEIIGDWRELHNKEPHYLYYSPNIIRIMKSRWMI
jgi:hypothetical protein